MKNIRRMTFSRCDSDRAWFLGSGEGFTGCDDDNLCNEGKDVERFGAFTIEDADGGKRSEVVDQVVSLCKEGSEPMRCGGRSVVGVDGGVLAEARTSNWREMYAREFIGRQGLYRSYGVVVNCRFDGAWDIERIIPNLLHRIHVTSKEVRVPISTASIQPRQMSPEYKAHSDRSYTGQATNDVRSRIRGSPNCWPNVPGK